MLGSSEEVTLTCCILALCVISSAWATSQEESAPETPPASRPGCGNERLQRLLREETELDSDSFKHPANEAQLDAACRRLKNYHRRLWKYLNRCMGEQLDEDTVRSLDTDRELQNRLCQDQEFKQKYLRHSKCIREITPKLRNCSAQLPDSISPCCAMVEHRKCSRLQAEASCGEEAAEYAEEYLTVVYASRLQECPSGCEAAPLPASSSSLVPSGGGPSAFLCLLPLLVAASGVVVAVRR